MRADADRWRARGWITVNFTYRPFAHGRVTQTALDDFHAREAQLVSPVVSGTGTAAGLLR